MYANNLCQIKALSKGNPVKIVQIEFLQANVNARAGAMTAIPPVDSVLSSPNPDPIAAKTPANL